MRYTKAKNRIARRENSDLGFKTPGSKAHASLLKKINVLPGQHGAKGRRKVSEHGKQLREKQKLRYIFGVTEKQLKTYFQKAKRKTGNTGLYLAEFLEKRLDNMVFRMGLAPTRAASRQLVSHKHIKVNDKIVSVASYLVKPGDVITVADEKTLKIPMVESALANQDLMLPQWVQKKGTVGTMVEIPTSEYIEKQVDLRLVIEFYSR
jgi:small subunit ribosomal protein S4